MALREFSDEHGSRWQVWSTYPTTAKNEERVREQLSSGWLTFLSGKTRKRLVPVPSGWETATDDDLRAWLHDSEHAPPYRRLP